MDKNEKNITIYSISQKLGLSPSTVSRALRGSPLVREETRKRVLRVAKELGYATNSFARSLRTKKSHIIAIITEDITNPFTSLIIKGIEEVTAKNNYHIIYGNGDGNLNKEKRYLNALIQRQIEGLIYISTVSREIKDFYLNTSIPVIFSYSYSLTPDIPSIIPDDLYGGYIATEYLIKLGHKRIAFIFGPAGYKATTDRLAGSKKAFEDYNLDWDHRLVRHCKEWDSASGYKEALDLLSKDIIPTAIFAGNDLIAVGVMDALREKGLNVPKDISVVGYDDREVCGYVRPKLTTVRLPLVEIGKKSAEILINHINGKNEGIEAITRVKGELIIRDSCCSLGFKSKEVMPEK